jgi:hypothetical protein
MMVSAYRVVLNVQGQILTITDDVIDVTIADGIDQMPQASITLPLKRNAYGGRIPYSEIIRPGDGCLIEVLASHGRGEDWVTVLDGIVRSVSDNERISAGGREVSSTVEVGSYADILAEDTVAWWMFLGSIAAYARVRTKLTEDQLNQAPYKVGFTWLTQIAMQFANYDNFGATLPGRLHVAFNGLEANSILGLSLTMVEGSHWSVLSGMLDAPLHEMYVTTAPFARLPAGGERQAATTPIAADQGATSLIWRASPYVYADEGGNAVADEWNALRVHTLDDVTPVVDARGGSYTKAALRNFVICYPAYQFTDEEFAYAYGAAIVNRLNIKTFGYRPLKVRTHLILNNQTERQNIIEWMHALSYRVAGQWNNTHLLKNGVVSCPLDPNIRPGERVRFPDPWSGEDLFEYHVRGRQISLDPVRGARMMLNVERGAAAKRYADPAWLMDGLTKYVIGAHTEYNKTYRGHDDPGYGGRFT